MEIYDNFNLIITNERMQINFYENFLPMKVLRAFSTSKNLFNIITIASVISISIIIKVCKNFSQATTKTICS